MSTTLHQDLLPAAISDADRQAIQAGTDQWVRSLLAKDWDSLAALYTDDATLMPPNQPAISGREAIRQFNANFPPLADFVATNERIEGVGDMAYVRGHYRMVMAGPDADVDVGKYLEIRKRQPDGTWKYSLDIFNSSMPLP